jgi:hypothetical protein
LPQNWAETEMKGWVGDGLRITEVKIMIWHDKFYCQRKSTNKSIADICYTFEAVMKYYLLYIDPGSGSYLIQVIIATVLSTAFFLKNFWYKIKSFFVKRKPEEDENNAE